MEGGDRDVDAADAILLLHGIIVLFNIGALPLIWMGHFRKWAFVRNFYFRVVHLLLIGIVAAESVFGVICPLTTLEDALRSGTGADPMHDNGFVAHWLHQLLFYDLPPWVFTVAYVLFFLLVGFTYCWVRPQLPTFRQPARR